MSEAPAQTQLVNELAVYLARHPEATPMRRPPASPRHALLPRFACRDDVVDVLWSPQNQQPSATARD
ncbi:MAG: hypothetical protein QOJ28_1404 [Mycobacterium sp.]|nr:hypothetical protein [Mycobacterium sp.]